MRYIHLNCNKRRFSMVLCREKQLMFYFISFHTHIFKSFRKIRNSLASYLIVRASFVCGLLLIVETFGLYCFCDDDGGNSKNILRSRGPATVDAFQTFPRPSLYLSSTPSLTLFLTLSHYMPLPLPLSICSRFFSYSLNVKRTHRLSLSFFPIISFCILSHSVWLTLSFTNNHSLSLSLSLCLCIAPSLSQTLFSLSFTVSHSLSTSRSLSSLCLTF